MAEHDHDHADHGHGDHDHPLGPHIINLLALFVLTAVTYGVSLIHLGHLADIVAFAIAALKASLVIMIFMHVKGSSRLIKLASVSGFFWIFLLFAYLVGDVMTRPGNTVFEGWQDDVRKPVAASAGHHGDEAHGGDDAHGDDDGHGDDAAEGDH
ncbi:MAG: cytochrome C oxidase subunit IV family protein [Acidobacteriota bacterium]